MERTKNIYPAVIPWLEQGKPLALATILETKGSTPQVPGASALFSEQGLILGTLGGGILEAAAQKKALRCLRKSRSIIYEFKLQGGAVAGEEALCGGSALILIDASPGDHLAAFRKMRAGLHGRRSGLLVTPIASGRERDAEIRRLWLEEKEGTAGWVKKRWPIKPAEVEEAHREGRPRLVISKKADAAEAGRKGMGRRRGKSGEKTLFFVEPLSPLPRLVIAGAGHVGRAVAHIGHLLEFDVTVIDDRPEFANKERLPEAERIIVQDVGRALAAFPVAPDTFIVIVTRGHRNDADALRSCIKSSAAYIGMIGSRRKIDLMRREFTARGWATAQEFDRVHAPIGLEIGSKTVEEIAVSIAAELVLVRRGGDGGTDREDR